MKTNLSAKFVENVRKRIAMVTSGTAEECDKKQPEINYDSYKHYQTEDEGYTVTIYSLKKQKLTSTKPILVGFTTYDLSKFSWYKLLDN